MGLSKLSNPIVHMTYGFMEDIRMSVLCIYIMYGGTHECVAVFSSSRL